MLAVSARGDTLRAALDRAYTGIGCVGFEGMQYRRDIAHRALRGTGDEAKEASKVI